MAALSTTAFLAKWATLFANNSSRDISEEDVRDFRQDIADSFMNVVDRSITGAIVLLADYDASTDLFPDTGVGSSSDGSIKKGDAFPVSVAGSPGGFFIDAGAWLVAKVDNPGQTDANWRRLL